MNEAQKEAVRATRDKCMDQLHRLLNMRDSLNGELLTVCKDIDTMRSRLLC